MHLRLASAVSVVFAVGGCALDDAPAGPEAEIAIDVAALSLPGVVDACYGLRVLDAGGLEVWSEPSLCASDFGDGQSALAYVGPCDAGSGAAAATVVLTITGLYGPDTAADADSDPDLLTDYRDPCAAPYAPTGCRMETTCRAGADVAVSFDLTLMRQANQGFFDVAVTFEDIFCSAKVDCAYAGSGPITLVADPLTGSRVQTVVWALACTDGDPGGASAASTHLYMDDVVLRCGGVPYPIAASAGPGNVYPNGVGAPPPLVQAMVFETRESALDADVLGWSVALGLRPSYFAPPTGVAPSCTLETRATAARGPFTGGVSPAGTRYPYITVSVPVNVGPDIVCTQHPLDGGVGVATAYTDVTPVAFDHEGRQVASQLVTAPICTVTGPDTDCDGVDDDCDGSIDEGYLPDASCFLPGVCAVGSVASSCSAGVPSVCQTGAPTGGDVDCNGLDDDCDGTPDDGGGCTQSEDMSSNSGQWAFEVAYGGAWSGGFAGGFMIIEAPNNALVRARRVNALAGNFTVRVVGRAFWSGDFVNTHIKGFVGLYHAGVTSDPARQYRAFFDGSSALFVDDTHYGVDLNALLGAVTGATKTFDLRWVKSGTTVQIFRNSGGVDTLLSTSTITAPAAPMRFEVVHVDGTSSASGRVDIDSYTFTATP